MNPRPGNSVSQTMKLPKRVVLWGLMAACCSAAAADDAALRACRAMADTAARLACYDALPLAAALGAALTQGFGRERKDDVAEIVSHIPGLFEGWGPRTRFTLANGQVWQVEDGSSGVYALRDPKVTVRRAALSGFELEVEGAKRVPRVRRVN